MNILIADDHRLFLDGLKHLIQTLYPDAEIIEAINGIGALEVLSTKPTIDLALIDLRLPGLNGFTLLKELSRTNLFIPVIIISSSEDPSDIEKALSLGASGFVSKSFTSSELQNALNTVSSGRIYQREALYEVPECQCWAKQHHITPRQLEVLRLAKKGEHNIEIAEHLFITERTVKAHVAALFESFKARSRSELIYKAGQLGLD